MLDLHTELQLLSHIIDIRLGELNNAIISMIHFQYTKFCAPARAIANIRGSPLV